ncbi:MAG: hypothetical protein A2X94_15165 [Bdellovibrionales bacterium GWB1_55_8]|nr:MAG: hypothetical protein A2X94_15165 [Bdellovibrionales bacterium GWB1_55_8]
MTLSHGFRFGWVLIVAVLASSCGREVPEGYVPVRLEFGNGAVSYNLMAVMSEPVLPQSDDIYCGMEKLVVSVFGPGINPPLHHRIGGDLPPKVNLSAFARADSGQAFQGIGTRFLVPKGPERRFILSGLFRGSDIMASEAACEGESVYPVFGVSSLINVDQSLAVGLSAFAHGTGFRIEQVVSEKTVDIEGTPFVALTVTWPDDISGFGLAHIRVRDVAENMALTSPSGVYVAIPVKSAWRFAPLIPGRKYELSLEQSGITRRFYYATGLLQEQAKVFTLADGVEDTAL